MTIIQLIEIFGTMFCSSMLVPLYVETTRRVCRFYDTKRGCYRGDECPFLHLQQGMTSLKVNNCTSVLYDANSSGCH